MMRQTVSQLLVYCILLVAALASAWVQVAHATVIQTPADLLPGEQFRIIFLTTGTRDATSAIIGDYDAFVNADAGSVTYDGQPVSFLAIGSTATVHARDHIGQYSVPVYLNDGVRRIANSDTVTTPELFGLWSGSLRFSINKNISGVALPGAFTWTGTNASGMGFVLGPAHRELGTNVPEEGGTVANTGWVALSFDSSSLLRQMYGISSVLTVPAPEPSSFVLLGFCVSTLFAVAVWRRKASQYIPVPR